MVQGSGRAEHAFVITDLDGNGPQALGVGTAVVGAEQEVGAAGEDGTDSGAGAAAVATLGRGDRRSGGCRGHHVLSNTR
jgi:hypothetical protein